MLCVHSYTIIIMKVGKVKTTGKDEVGRMKISIVGNVNIDLSAFISESGNN